ncbi:hypothetical protein FQN57_005679 [Myotisia sp. PD_48]|nr:hypothetical protein FQN57_005679 [Myotisia sp. PD_48]
MAVPIDITDECLAGLKDKVVIISGGSSGIGHATVSLLLELGAKVVIGDRNPPPEEILNHEAVTFVKIDVTIWKELCALFKEAKDKHGRIDHAFCNAGIAGVANYFDQSVDADGDPVEPNHKTIEINLLAVVNMTKLAIWYMSKQETGGSIVLTASASSFQRLSIVDYTVAKHGVLGLMRGMVPLLHPTVPIRINSLAPSWTETGIVNRLVLESVGAQVQGPEAVARSAALVMADETRHGNMIYSIDGKFTEIDQGMIAAYRSMVDGLKEEEAIKRLATMMRQKGTKDK